MNNLIDNQYFALTADIWTSDFNKNSFLDIHLNWFCRKSNIFRHSQLAMLNMDQKHTAANIKDSILNEIAKYGTESVEQTYITTDCAENMSKAVKKFQA